MSKFKDLVNLKDPPNNRPRLFTGMPLIAAISTLEPFRQKVIGLSCKLSKHLKINDGMRI